MIGLAVMGQNLVLNMAGKGVKVAVHNRTVETAKKFMAERAKGLPVEHGEALEDFVALLDKPRVVMIMVKAGEAVDDMIGKVAPLLSSGDLVIDLGNSHFKDTERRAGELSEKGIEYMGAGVSGGEEGALEGPSIMPGGSKQAYSRVKDIFEKIAAKTDDGPCVAHIGPGAAGHYVKMVHNGLEYGDMQLIAETYDVLRRIGFLSAKDMAGAFRDYNRGELKSYLMEITARILEEKDPETNKPLLEVVLDRAGQKGTGAWAAQNALELGMPVPTITAAVEARNLSAQKELRVEADRAIVTVKPKRPPRTPQEYTIRAAGRALYAGRLSLYAQGMALLKAASEEYGYDLDIPEIARIWKGGCIIRSALLDVIIKAFTDHPGLPNLLMDPDVVEAIDERYDNWGNVSRIATALGVPCPALYSSLAYFEGLRTSRLPANLIAAQRDLFGAHTFERVDREGSFHHQWKKK
jgi:6-phosphogluconate dehydrogenase